MRALIALCRLHIVMATLGPVVVVAERPSADLVEALGKAGAFPIIETGLADAAAAIEQIQPRWISRPEIRLMRSIVSRAP